MKSYKKYLATIVVTLSLVVMNIMAAFSVSAADDIPQRPQPQRLVNDLAQIFSASQISSLEQKLVAFDDSTSNQITVVTVSDLNGYEPAEFATKIGIAWGVGSKDFNNGIVLLVKPKTESSSGQVSIQIGYGLEGAIPDAYCKRIIENDIIPHFKENDYFGGVDAAVDVLMGLASGEISEPRDGSDEEEGDGIVLILFLFIMFLAIIAFSRKNKNSGKNGGSSGGSHRSGGPVIFYGPSSGSSSGYSGGSSSGGSFGGFGGGSFGGGGASGSW